MSNRKPKGTSFFNARFLFSPLFSASFRQIPIFSFSHFFKGFLNPKAISIVKPYEMNCPLVAKLVQP